MSATSTKQSNEAKPTAATEKGPREGSVMWAVIQVLEGKRAPMTPAAILAEIQKRGLAKKLNGKTPEASVAARLAVHAAKGLYVERPEKGKYRLKTGTGSKPASKRERAKPNTKTKGRQGDGARSAAQQSEAPAPAEGAHPQEPASA
jgi:HB1, ASXL, restriction endonuclease HTH domain